MTEHESAVRLEKALKAVNELGVVVVSRDPRLRLKERARLARLFFKSHKLQGLSVRVATGANCCWVEVGIPDMDHDEQAHKVHGFRTNKTDCPGCVFRHWAKLKLEEILQRAFPREIDETDHMTDYFAPAWLFRDMPQTYRQWKAMNDKT